MHIELCPHDEKRWLISLYSGAFGGLLATGLSQIPQWGIIHSWRNIFFFEGLISIALGVTAFLVLPKSPGSASFLTADERVLAERRIRLDTRSSASEKMEARYIRRALLSINTALMSAASFCSLLTMNSMSLFVPSILKGMGYSGLHSQIMSVPPYAWAATVCVTITYLSDRTRIRGPWLIGVMLFSVAGFATLLQVTALGVHYFALFLCLTGSFTASPTFMAWSVDNSAGHTTRAIVAATVAAFGSVAGILATWTYLSAEAPRYITGHSINLSFTCLCIIIITISSLYLRWENRQRSLGRRNDRLQGLTPVQAAQLGHTHPEFRFTL